MNIKSILLIIAAFATISTKAQTVTDDDLKKNITKIDRQASEVLKLQPISFEYSKDLAKQYKLPAGKQYGLLAEEVAKVFPELVREEKKLIPAGKNAFKTETIKTVNMESLIPVLLASLKEQQAEIDQLKTEVGTLKTKVNSGM